MWLKFGLGGIRVVVVGELGLGVRVVLSDKVRPPCLKDEPVRVRVERNSGWKSWGWSLGY